MRGSKKIEGAQVSDGFIKPPYLSYSVPGASMGVPTHDKGHAERPDMQRRVRAQGAPLDLPEHLPKTKICLFYYFTTFTNSSDINGGLCSIAFL